MSRVRGTADQTATRRQRIDIASILRLTELADLVVPFAVRAVAELRIADLLAAGPRPVDDLAGAAGADPDALARTLRLLAGRGVFTETEPGTFGLTPLAEPLRSDHPVSLRGAYPLLPADINAWARFDHSVRTGGSASIASTLPATWTDRKRWRPG